MNRASSHLKFWASVPALSIGAVGGVLLLITLRGDYLNGIGAQPQVTPQIAYLFSPIICAAVLLVAIPLEAALRRFSCAPETLLQQIAVGAVHATSISWWAFPLHWYLVFVANPIVLRWTLGIIFRSKGDQPESLDDRV